MNQISSSSIRFVGMATGLDVDSIVSAMIEAEQLKVDAIKQKQTVLEWKSNELKSVNSQVSAFLDKYFSAANPDTNINMNSSFNTKKVDINSKYVSITASSSALEESYVINSITSLAKASSAVSGTGISQNQQNKIYTGMQLKDLNLKTSLEFAEGTDTEGNAQNTIAFNINGVDFQFKDTDTLQTVFNTVNRSNAGVNMSYSTLSDKVTIKSKALGADSEILIANTEGNFFSDGAVEGASGIASGIVKNGTNAVLSINNYDVEQTSNNFVIDGVSYNLLGTTDDEIDFTITQDIDSIYTRIKGFVDGYNELIGNLNSKVLEERYRTYLPLTESQKDAMSDKEIELWDEKAKSGMLKSDSRIRKLLTDIRNAFVQTVEDAGLSFSEIGIKTSIWSERGKLHIDETKLKNALAENGESISKLFLNKSDSNDKYQRYSGSGLVQRINDSMKEYINNVKKNVLDQNSKQISNYSDKISYALTKLNEKEAHYYAQYAALESAISKLNSQSSSFSSMLGS